MIREARPYRANYPMKELARGEGPSESLFDGLARDGLIPVSALAANEVASRHPAAVEPIAKVSR